MRRTETPGPGLSSRAASRIPASLVMARRSTWLAGDPAQAATNLFQSADGRFKSGIWEAQPGKWRVVFTESEFCHLLAGVIVVTGDDGSQCTFRAGDAFVSPAGFLGTWEIIEPAKKLYANYE